MGPTWALSASDGPHVDPMNLAIRDITGGKDFVIFQVKREFRQQIVTTPVIMTPFMNINWVYSLRPGQNGRYFAEDIFICIFICIFNENVWISLAISLKFFPEVRINNIPALVQIMAWRRPGDKPLSESMMVSLLTDICVTRPQWINGSIAWKRLVRKLMTDSA